MHDFEPMAHRMVWTGAECGASGPSGRGRVVRAGVVGVAVMGIGLALIFTRGVEVFHAQAVRAYVPVEARVVEVGVQRGGSRREPFVPLVRYTYSAGGQRHEQSTFGPTTPWFGSERAALNWLASDGVEVGGLVEAYHDPSDPSRAVLTTYADPKRVVESKVALGMGGAMSLAGGGLLAGLVLSPRVRAWAGKCRARGVW